MHFRTEPDERHQVVERSRGGALIVGGGIGGLSTALALRTAGHDAQVVELQADLHPSVCGWGSSGRRTHYGRWTRSAAPRRAWPSGTQPPPGAPCSTWRATSSARCPAPASPGPPCRP
ncbi:NAD(P)-binding protein [Streptomyces hirsutus]|uniref:NAD(P)-binding protein n=1 Tax=Streptomyces hirsutus TaxID=35620 RepID=UPI0036CA045A